MTHVTHPDTLTYLTHCPIVSSGLDSKSATIMHANEARQQRRRCGNKWRHGHVPTAMASCGQWARVDDVIELRVDGAWTSAASVECPGFDVVSTSVTVLGAANDVKPFTQYKKSKSK